MGGGNEKSLPVVVLIKRLLQNGFAHLFIMSALLSEKSAWTLADFLIYRNQYDIVPVKSGFPEPKTVFANPRVFNAARIRRTISNMESEQLTFSQPMPLLAAVGSGTLRDFRV